MILKKSEHRLKATEAQMQDGARNALLGYLYQLIGTATVRVYEVDPGNYARAQLIAHAGGSIHSEEFGQDAVTRSATAEKTRITAIQFKHSAVAGNALERSELLDIVTAFERSRREAASRGQTIDRFFLITNRRLHADATKLIDHSKCSSAPHDDLKAFSGRGKGRPSAAREQRLRPFGGNPMLAAAAWHEVLGKLDVIEGAAFEDDLQRLHAFARRYGVLEHEWEGRLNALIGAFVNETATGGSIEVSREWLKKHLVGNSHAANLDFGSKYAPHISKTAYQQIRDRLENQHRIPEQCCLERQAHQEIESALAICPLVFVVGGGGCGKSLTVARYLLSVANTQFVCSQSARTASEPALVGSAVAARFPNQRYDCPDRTLSDFRSRLEVANRGNRRVWLIDLDGVDEAPERRAELSYLISLCWAQGRFADSPASLIVTCRSSTGSITKDQLIREWLDTPEVDLARNVGFVSINEFADDELVVAARLIGGAPEIRIVSSVSGEEHWGGAGRFHAPEPIPMDFLKTLRHPVVWGSYATLEEPEREAFLNGNASGSQVLAKRLYDRFLGRCKCRKDWYDETMLERALPAIAASCPSPAPYQRDRWDQACGACLSSTESSRLYHECLTYGIIERDVPLSWRWRHTFLIGYLAALGGGHVDE